MNASEFDHPTRTDLRRLDDHYSWEQVYRHLGVEPSAELNDVHPDTYFAMIRNDRPDRYRWKHALGVTS